MSGGDVYRLRFFSLRFSEPMTYFPPIVAISWLSVVAEASVNGVTRPNFSKSYSLPAETTISPSLSKGAAHQASVHRNDFTKP